MNEIQQKLERNTLNTVSLFSGAGGLDIGAIMSGANIIWANDKMREACDSYSKNIGTHIHKGDIDELKPELEKLKGSVFHGHRCIAGKIFVDGECNKI